MFTGSNLNNRKMARTNAINRKSEYQLFLFLIPAISVSNVLILDL
jgi:hypothetical protein